MNESVYMMVSEMRWLRVRGVWGGGGGDTRGRELECEDLDRKYARHTFESLTRLRYLCHLQCLQGRLRSRVRAGLRAYFSKTEIELFVIGCAYRAL